MTEEQRFADFLDKDTTFWGGLYRAKGVKTFEEARRVTEEFCKEARALDENEQIKTKPVDYLGITRSFVA